MPYQFLLRQKNHNRTFDLEITENSKLKIDWRRLNRSYKTTISGTRVTHKKKEALGVTINLFMNSLFKVKQVRGYHKKTKTRNLKVEIF